MSFNRYAKRVDESQRAIRDALRAAGWTVWVIGWPCDLLIWKAGRGFRTIECKSPYNADGSQRKRKDQGDQVEFLQLTGTPIALTAEQALRLVGAQ